MRSPSPVVPFLASLALLLSACGAGDGSGDEAALQADMALRARLGAAGVTPLTAPPPADPALVELGRALFFDKILSGNMNISCATCHHPVAGTGDDLPVSIGQGGSGLATDRVLGTASLIPRNAPHVFNAGAWGVDSMFWDSRITRDPATGALKTPDPALNGLLPARFDITTHLGSTLEAQAMFPVTSAEEMRGHAGENEIADAPDNQAVWAALMARLVGTDGGAVGGIDGYRTLFAAAYPEVASTDDLNFGHAARAIGAFERHLGSALDSPFDRYLAGDDAALSAAAKRGALLFFGEAGCATCHNGPLLTDLAHYAICVPQVGPGKLEPSEDRGRALQTGDPADDYKFRTPPLRNVAITAPYMHDGAFTTLDGAVRHHLDPTASLASFDVTTLPPLFQSTVDTDAGRNAARAAALAPELVPVSLSEGEIQDLLAFLESLTDARSLDLLGEEPATVPSGLPVAD